MTEPVVLRSFPTALGYQLGLVKSRERMSRSMNRKHVQIICTVLLFAGCLIPSTRTAAQSVPAEQNQTAHAVSPVEENTMSTPDAVREALRLVSSRTRAAGHGGSVRNTIVIGFVGGFVKHDDPNHPEVHFATLLRAEYRPGIHAEVFSNHDGTKALNRALQWLDTNSDGVISSSEKTQSDIIIYGHSWGASQTVRLARELGRRGIPVALTIQIDSVRKPRQDDSRIPPNVRNAMNFYQTKGLIHGRQMIAAANPELTNILGNVKMTYRNHEINCDNYPWMARHLNRGHHEIENDPVVWDQIGSLIDAELSKTTTLLQASVPSPQLSSK